MPPQTVARLDCATGGRTFDLARGSFIKGTISYINNRIQDKFIHDYIDNVICVEGGKKYYTVSLDFSSPLAPFKVGESEWYGPPPTV